MFLELKLIKTNTVNEDVAQQILTLSVVVEAVDSSGLGFQIGGQLLSVKVDIGDTE